MRKHNSIISSQRAFTLAELLIVIAIIGILVGISIPVFAAQKEKSAETTDIANMRAAKAAAVQVFYSGISDADSADAYGFTWYNSTSTAEKSNAWGVYDADAGTFISSGKGKKFKDLKITLDDAYGQGTDKDGGTVVNGYNANYDYTDAVIMVTIFPNGIGTNVKQYGYDISLKDTPCIIIEWRRLTNNKPYVGRDVGKFTGQVIFLEE